ncbi:Shedu anti-phage system protein SduA domain-containing protein [Hoeflea sp. CAU 1731]
MLEEAIKKFYSSSMNLSVLHEFLSVCIQDRGLTARDHVRNLFSNNYGGHTFKWEFKQPAGLALLAWGDAGIAEMKRVFLEDDNFSNRRLVFEILSALAAGESPIQFNSASSEVWAQVTDCGRLPPAIQVSARRTLVDLVLSIEATDDVAGLIGGALQQQQFRKDGAAVELIRAASSRWLAIGDSVLNDFQKLIVANADDEPSFQNFFEANPQLLDPMAIEVWPQPNLFGSKKPDFVVKRSDGSYLIVEIECPGKSLITKAGHPSAAVTHAEHQAIDYRNYMLKHVGNAKTVFPGFSDPDCLVVVGLESTLSDDNKIALASLNGNRHRFRVVGFDWLLERAQRVSQNVTEHGVIVSVQRMT